MKHKPSVTVAVCVYNEEANIKALLDSLVMQKEDGFILEHILVVSDGSEDNTVKIVKSFNNPKIVVKNYKKRIGKSDRLNEIYASLKSDILVETDGDVIFSNPHVVRDLTRPLIKDQKIAMCGGNPQPLPGKTFTEKAVNYTCEIYIGFRKSVRGGNNLFSADGRLLAYRKDLVKKIHIPQDMIANDAYTYFCCLTLGYSYKYVESAIVNFRSPQTLNDQVRQNSRFLAAPIRMARYFPKELVKRETSIPASIRLRSLITQFIKNPIACLYIFIVNRYSLFKALLNEKKLTAIWDVAQTTKSLKTH